MVDQQAEPVAELSQRAGSRTLGARDLRELAMASSADRLTWFREITRTRQTLEPYIGSFARFHEAASKRFLEIGVGAGSDFIEWCRHADHATASI